MDLAKKRRQYRYEIKRSLNLKEGDTVQSVVNKVPTADVFDSEDFELQVDTWCLRLFRYFHLFIYFVEEIHILTL